MKKVSVKTAVKKFIAVTAAALMLGSGMAFVSCSSDDGSDNDTDQTVNPENPNPSNPDTPSNSDEKVDEDSGDLGNSLVYDFDTLTSVPETKVGDNSILDGNVVYWVADGKTGNAKVTANTDETHHYLQVSAGGNIDADLTKVDLSNQTTFLKLKAAQAGEEEIIFTFTTVKGGSDSDNRILIVDPATGNILGQTETIPCGTSDDNTEKTLSVKATVPETFYVVFARSNGKGGFKFSKIEQKYGTAKAAQEAPVESDFTVADPTSADAKGTITYNGEKIANLQYKDGETWYKWGTEAAKEFAAGKVTVRYGSTETEKASETLELTINEYVNTELEAASAPAAGSVTSTATTNAENNDGTLVVDTEKEARALEYKLGDGNWTSFVENKATGLAGGTYTIRVKASETYNASTETISVIVKKFTAAPANADFTVTLASSDTAADATITAKSADVVANLMIVGAGAEGADASWSEIAGSETPLTVTVKAGTYKAYYAETETSVKSAESEIVVGVKVIFSEFVADGLKDADSSNYEALTSKDGLVTTGARSKYQNNGWSTYDYNAETGTGYTYTARVKVNKASGDAKGTLTINNVAVGSVLRIDGGNANGKDVRAVSFKGTDSDSTNWEATAMGSFYVTATAETVVLTSETNEFCIYGIHVVNEKVAATVAKSEKNYGKPVIALSETSVVKDAVVTVTETIPDVISKDYYSDGKVNSSTEELSLPLTYKVAPVTAEGVGEYTDATVTDGKITASEAGKFSYTASYTIGEGEEATTYTSEPVTLEVSAGFNPTEKEIENSNEILGLTATSVSSNNEEVAKAELKEDKIVITSVAQGNALITFGDGTNSGSINVTVNAGGEITATVNAYSAATTDSWNLVLSEKNADGNYVYGSVEFKNTTNIAKDTVLPGASGNLNMTITGDKFQINTAKAVDGVLYGVLVKNYPITISAVKGKVKLTVVWGTEGKIDRKLSVKVGSGAAVETDATGKNIKTETESYEVSFDGGSTGTDVVIGCTNDSFIKSITISAQ